MEMTDEEIVKIVKELEAYLIGKDKSEYLGCSAISAMKLMANACHESNANTLTTTLSDCWFNNNLNEKFDYKIVIKKLAKKTKKGSSK